MIQPFVSVLLQIAGLAAIGSWLFTRKYSNSGSGAALLLAGAGVLIFLDGFSLGVLEESRARYGQVVSGVVEERLSSSGADGTRTIGGRSWGRRGPTVRTTGFDAYEELARLLQTGSTDAWVVDYRYGCTVGVGTCRGRDFVARDLWMHLHAGQPINVRQSKDETSTARLDENPQFSLALIKTAIACGLLTLAAAISGRLTLFRRRRYLRADAVVTAVESVHYGGDATRWKIRFAYFDINGDAQDSADEVNDSSWKVGDHCYAVYRPEVPDLATLHGRAEPHHQARCQTAESPLA